MQPLNNLCKALFQLNIGLACCLPVIGWALPDDNQQPINVEANRAEHSTLKDGEKTEYFGNVVMTQGSMLLTGDHVIIYSKQGAVEKVLSFGKPAHFQQQSDPEKVPVKAYGERIEYTLIDETVRLRENASVIQDGSTVTGQRIDYNINSEQVQAKSTEQQRVQMVLQPAAKPTKDSQEPHGNTSSK